MVYVKYTHGALVSPPGFDLLDSVMFLSQALLNGAGLFLRIHATPRGAIIDKL